MVHLYNEILLCFKKGGSLTLCDGTDGPGEYYAKQYNPVRERQIPYYLTNMWNLMNKIN